ncbi:hypothetical protein ACLOJK_008533 [Asimina triloba]
MDGKNRPSNSNPSDVDADADAAAMEDVLTEQPPPSRFFVEDLNNFTPPPPPLPPPLLLFSSQNPDPHLRRPSLLIIAISHPSLALFHHLPPKTLIGTLILPELPHSGNSLRPSLRDRSCHLYALDRSPSTLLAAVQYSVAAERSHAVARSLLAEIRPENVLVLDSVQSRNFRGKLPIDDTFAYKLETSNQRAGDPIVRDLEYFPSGSVIDGLGAAVLARCQIEKLKGTLCVSWPESGNSVVALLRCLLMGVLPDLEFGSNVGVDSFRAVRNDSELYTMLKQVSKGLVLWDAPRQASLFGQKVLLVMILRYKNLAKRDFLENFCHIQEALRMCDRASPKTKWR